MEVCTMTTTLVWQRTTYSDGHQEYPAVYVRWDDVTAYLGRPHDGSSDDDARLVLGLHYAGAPDWVQDAPGWIDEHGWGLYRTDHWGRCFWCNTISHEAMIEYDDNGEPICPECKRAGAMVKL
jgi:hypothetical protein